MQLFEGRLNRKKFLLWCLPYILLTGAFKGHVFNEGSPAALTALLLDYVALGAIIVAAVRRSHDLAKSGWFALFMLIPFAWFYFVFKRSDGDNEDGSAAQRNPVQQEKRGVP